MAQAKWVAALGAIAMMVVLAHGFIGGDFATEGRQLLRMPWGRVSLVDLYVGFVLFSCWIVYRDGFSFASILWIAAVMMLGSLAICLYVLVTLQRSRRDWPLFFRGRHAEEEHRT